MTDNVIIYVPTLPREIVPPSDPLEIVPPGGKSEGGTISRTVGGWPFWCEEGRAKVVPATPLKLYVGAKYRFFFWGGGQFHGGGSVIILYISRNMKPGILSPDFGTNLKLRISC